LTRLTHTRAPEKKFPLFCQMVPQEKRQKSGLTDKKSGPTDKKVDLNGQKSYPNGTKNCPLVPLFLSVSPIFVLGSSRHFFCRFSGGSEALFFRSPKVKNERSRGSPPLFVRPNSFLDDRGTERDSTIALLGSTRQSGFPQHTLYTDCEWN
jgi:hypothetical protein